MCGTLETEMSGDLKLHPTVTPCRISECRQMIMSPSHQNLRSHLRYSRISICVRLAQRYVISLSWNSMLSPEVEHMLGRIPVLGLGLASSVGSGPLTASSPANSPITLRTNIR